MRPRTTPFLPAALLGLLTLWCGTFQGAASAWGAVAHPLAVLLFCLLAPGLRDPLALGERGRWLPWLLIAAAILSWAFSPVARAGLVGLVLLPAYLLLPTSVARCWARPRDLQIGLSTLAAVTLLICITALLRWHLLSLPRASLPLGHHNLLAGWLVLVLPAVLAGAGRAGASRWLALGAGAGGLVTLFASGSLLGALAVGLQASIAAVWWRRLRFWLIAAAILLAVTAVPRLTAISGGVDLSALARLSYLEAGLRGLMKRPLLGWGPGSAPWTMGEFMRPAVEIHPASQIVADLHSLPIQIGYELGFAGLLSTLLVTGAFILRRQRESGRPGKQRMPRQAAILGLAGGVLFALGSAPLAVPALPATVAVVAGLSLPPPVTRSDRYRFTLLALYILLALRLLIPASWAHLVYDDARRQAEPERRLETIARAHAADPAFPLYLARWSWLASQLHGVDRDRAQAALQAAEMAPGLAPLWLAAGDLGRRAGLAWARDALARARSLDPLSPLPTFHLMLVQAREPEAVRLGAEAIIAEPRLAAARWWSDHLELAERISQRTGVPIPAPAESDPDAAMILALTLDHDPAVSFSLFAFRRSPWPGYLAPVELGGDESTNPNTRGP